MSSIDNLIADGDRYQINTVALDIQFSEKDTANQFVDYSITGETNVVTVSDTNFMTNDDIVSVDVLQARAQVTQPDPRKPFKCNFSFNLNLNLKIKLPDLSAPPPNFDLLFSINEFTREVSKINDDLIYTLRALNCCDLEKAYNTTIVPFFRWFADHKDIKYCSYDEPISYNCGPMFGDKTFPMILYDIAKVLVEIYIVVRPLICLLRPIPGNPWWPFDLDQTYFIKFIIMIFDLYYDIIVSGKIVDVILTHPTKKLRQTIEVCLFGTEEFNASQLNLTISQYKQLLDYLDRLNNRIRSIRINLNKLESEKNNYMNSYIKITYIKNNSGLIDVVNTTGLQTIDSSINNDKYSTIEVTMNDLLCFNEKHELQYASDNSDCKTKIFNKVVTSDVLISVTSGTSVTAEVTAKQPLNTKFNFSQNIQPTNNSNPFDSFIITLNDKANSIYENKIKDLENKIKNYQNNLKNLENTVKLITNQIKIINAQKSTELTAILNETYLTDASIKKMANNNNICDCLISVIESLFDISIKIPLPENITNLNKIGFEKVKDKESFKITFKDIDNINIDGAINIIKNLVFPSNSALIKDNDIDDKGIIYTKELINEISDLFRVSIEKNIHVYEDTNESKYKIKIFNNILDLSNLKIGNIKISDSLNGSDALSIYLKVVDDIFNKDLHYLYNIESKTKEITINDSETITFTYYEFSKDLLPTDVYPSTFIYLKEGTQKLIKYLESKREVLRKNYNKTITNDKNAKNDFCNLLSQKLNKINQLLIQQDITNFTQIGKLSAAQNELKLLQESLCFIEIPFNIENNFGLDYLYYYINHLNTFINQFGSEIDVKMNNKTIKVTLSDLQEQLNTWYTIRHDGVLNACSIEDKTIPYCFIQFITINDVINKVAEWYKDVDYVIQDWVWEKPEIPCTCDGIICKLIQMIINTLLALLTQLIQRFLKYIMDLFWKSPIGKLIKFIIAKLKCIMMIVNINKDLEKLRNLVDALEEALKNNIKLYVDPSVCLYNAIAENPNNFPIQYNPENNTISIPDAVTPENLANDIQDNPSITGINIDDPNYQSPVIEIVQNDNNNIEITTSGGDIPPSLRPKYSNYLNTLPATLVLTPQVEVGPPIQYPNHNFPLLTFQCNCDPDCEICNEETKEETINVFKV